MKIFFDARWTRFDTHDGISRYGANLAEALARLHPITLIIYDKRQLKLLPKDVPYVIVNNPFSPQELFIAKKFNALGADVVFSPLQTMGSWGRRYKLILTLQDLTYYTHPKPPTHLPTVVRALWWLYHKAYWPVKLLLQSADVVATVSETSKKLIQQRQLTNKPIVVVYNAPPALSTSLPKNSPRKELVFMGAFLPYKNAELLIRAMELLPDYTLHLASRISPQREAELKKLALHPEQLIFWHGASDETYATLLAQATALVTASRSEGFGLPLVEAMNRNVPVVCTDMPIFREVAGEAALFFNPDSPEDFAKKIRMLEDKTVRNTLVQKGIKQAAKFTWENSARQLLTTMQKLSS